MTESIVLGRNTQTQSAISVTQEHLESGTYVLGVQGVGKSSLLLDMLLQQLSQGESVIALDPHGDLVRDVIARMPAARLPDTYLLDLKEARKWPFGLNIFALPPDKINSPEARDSVRNQVMHAFEKLWPETRSGLYFGNVLRPVISTLIENQELTLAHVPRLFYHDPFREHYTKQVKNLEAQDFWGEYAIWTRSKRERYIDPLLDRIKKLLSDDVIRFTLCQKQSKLDLAEVLKQRKNILLRLPLRDPAYEYAAPIIGTFFMTLLQAAIFSFGNLPHARRPACTLVIDEFQNFVTEDNERFFSEGRKYKVKQVLAHQYMSQLDRDGLTTMKAAATSAYTIVSFRTNKDDSSEMAKVFTDVVVRPTNIYIDPVDRLDTHPAPTVKEFYLDYVGKLLQAAKQRLTHDAETLPWNFGFGETTYIPADAIQVREKLNSLLYYTQKEGAINTKRLEEFLNGYKALAHIVWSERRENPTVKQRLKQLREEIWQVDERIQRFIKTGSEIHLNAIAHLLDRSSDLSSQMAKLHCRDIKLTNAGNYQNNQEYLNEAAWCRREQDRLEQEFMQISERQRVLNEQLNREYWKIRQPMQDKENQLLDEVRKEEGRLFETVIHGERELPVFRARLLHVLEVLKAHPIAVESGILSAVDVAKLLQKQENRLAYVKRAATVSQMRTRDLNEQFGPVSWQEADERRNRIVKQTKDTYCRGRATVEQEIAAVYQVPESKKTGDDTEPPPTTGTPAKPPKQPPSGGRDGVKPPPDIFDKLDAHEPTE